MDEAPLSPDAVAAAEALVAQRKAKLDAARAEARASRSRGDWLGDRQDLLWLEQLIRDHPRRQSGLSKAQGAYQAAYEQRLAEKERDGPFQAPAELAGRLERLRWLAHALGAPSEAHLGSLLSDARLSDADKATIRARIQSNHARWVPLHSLWWTSKQPPGAAGQAEAEWAQYVESVHEGLRGLERELDEQKRAHKDTLRCHVERELHSLKEEVEAAQAAVLEAEMALARRREIDDYVVCRSKAFVVAHTREEQAAYNAAVRAREEARREARRRREAQQRAWWTAVAMHPIASLVEQLTTVPAEHVGAVMDRLLTLPATDPHVHHEEVHRFLLAHRAAVGVRELTAPVVVACVGRLVATGDDEAARALLGLCPAADRSPLASVVDYLRYVLREELDLSGVTDFRTLTAEDLFLAGVTAVPL